MNSSAEEVPFTELIQHPTRTTGRLANARALRLRRRDADDLMLMSVKRAEQEGEVVDLTARLLAGMLAERGGAKLIRQVLPAALPWVRFLPEAAVEELLSNSRASRTATGRHRPGRSRPDAAVRAPGPAADRRTRRLS
jgi:hypothetical protein